MLVLEGGYRLLEAQPMLTEVAARFIRVPLEAKGHLIGYSRCRRIHLTPARMLRSDRLRIR